MYLINKKKNAEDIKITLSRYESLIGLWQHHDNILLNWLPVVIAVIIGLAAFFNSELALSTVAKGVMLSGLGIVSLCITYAMQRVRIVRGNIGKEIDKIEDKLNINGAKLSDLQHPVGFPGTILLTWLTWAIGVSLFATGLYSIVRDLDNDTFKVLFVAIVTLLIILVFWLMRFFYKP